MIKIRAKQWRITQRITLSHKEIIYGITQIKERITAKPKDYVQRISIQLKPVSMWGKYNVITNQKINQRRKEKEIQHCENLNPLSETRIW